MLSVGSSKKWYSLIFVFNTRLLTLNYNSLTLKISYIVGMKSLFCSYSFFLLASEIAAMIPCECFLQQIKQTLGGRQEKRSSRSSPDSKGV